MGCTPSKEWIENGKDAQKTIHNVLIQWDKIRKESDEPISETFLYIGKKIEKLYKTSLSYDGMTKDKRDSFENLAETYSKLTISRFRNEDMAFLSESKKRFIKNSPEPGDYYFPIK